MYTLSISEVTSDLLSSGMYRVMICWMWEQRALQPYLSSRRLISTGCVRSGTRVHRVCVRCWTHSLGGHWGFAFLRSLRKTPADNGITFCGGDSTNLQTAANIRKAQVIWCFIYVQIMFPIYQNVSRQIDDYTFTVIYRRHTLNWHAM